MMPQTSILYPLKEEEYPLRSQGLEWYKKIKECMEKLYKKPRDVSFADVLDELGLDEEKYMFAIRSKIKLPKLYLKRGSLDVSTNAYNRDLLCLFEANMDIQFILDQFAVAAYIVNYMSKSEAGISKLLRQAVEDTKNGNLSIRQRLQLFANLCLNSTIMGSQEAVYLCLSMPLSKFSREVVFISTGPRESRVRMMKSKAALEKMDENDRNIFVDNVFEKYAVREGLDDLCLADFVATMTAKKGKDKVTYTTRERPRVIRYVNYSIDKQPAEFFREQCLLFLPWRNEEQDIETQNCATLYEENKDLIQQNQKKYVQISMEMLDEIIQKMKEHESDFEDEYDENDEGKKRENVSQNDAENAGMDVDIFEQAGDKKGGKKKTKKEKEVNVNRFFTPCKVHEKDMLKSLEILNSKQRSFVMHILKCIQNEQHHPFYCFLSGAAGVGKSTVINAIYQLATRYFDNIRGKDPDTIKVLLVAPSGKAAHLIHGTTLHTAFALPVNQYGNQLPVLSDDIANCVRVQLIDLGLIILDEVSMAGTKIFHWVDQRLRQIKGVNKPFGGVSVLVVGDLNQLAPVGDKRVFVPYDPGNSGIGTLFAISELWKEFSYYELTEIMRQRDEANFIEALNHLASGDMTEDDIKLFKDRETPEHLVPESAIRLFWSNEDVDNYNAMRIRNAPGEKFSSKAFDRVDGNLSRSVKLRQLQTLKNMKRSETYGLPYDLDLKVGIRYMVTTNIDIEDGLVNGACGILKHIEFDEENPTQPKTLFLDFNSDRVGVKTRREFKHNLGEAVNENWVPIQKVAREIQMAKDTRFQVYRTQFPLAAAEALTIHKSQGSTMESVCVNMERKLSRELLYVALSRVTKLSNLYIIGTFKPPAKPKEDDPTIAEIKRLKTTMPLKLSYNSLESKSGLVVGYHNVVSFFKYRTHIVNDQWYSRCDVLILSETQTTEKSQPTLPGFNLIFRSDDFERPQKRGILIFIKADVQFNKLHHEIEKSEEKKYHSDIVVFQIDDICVITGYKSPQTPAGTFKAQLSQALSAVPEAMKRVLIGDFNFNIHDGKNMLSKFMSENTMQSKLAPAAITARDHSQIDVVFSNFDNIIAGVYVSYFSDHNPVYFMTQDKDPSIERLREIESDWSEAKKTVVPAPLPPRQEIALTELLKREQEQSLLEEDEVDDVFLRDYSIIILDEVIEIEDDGMEDEYEVIIQAAREAYQFDVIIRNITTPFYELGDEAVDWFIDKLVNPDPRFNFNMISTLYAQRPSKYQPVAGDRDDLQIIFTAPKEKLHTIGHYIVAHFVAADNIVRIYDSLHGSADRGRVLKEEELIILSRLYPSRQVMFIEPATKQPDGSSCGVFAVANATSIIFGQDPASYGLKLTNYQRRDNTMALRNHLAQMYRGNQLELFPSDK